MFSLHERAIHTTEKLATRIRSYSRIKAIQTKAKNPMALVKVRSWLKRRVNFCLRLNDYVMIGENCPGERQQEWGLIRRLRKWNNLLEEPERGKWGYYEGAGKIFPIKLMKCNLLTIQPPAATQPASAAWSPAPRSLWHSAQLWGSHRKHLRANNKPGSGTRNGNLSCWDRHSIWRLP